MPRGDKGVFQPLSDEEVMQPRGEVAPWDEPLPPPPAGFQLERQPLSDAEVMQLPPSSESSRLMRSAALPEGFQLERPPHAVHAPHCYGRIPRAPPIVISAAFKRPVAELWGCVM
jgi:hypothetical protein